MEIKKKRLEQNLSQKALAEKINTNQTNISRYENGQREPSIKTAQALAKALGCTIDELLAESEVKETEESNQEHMK